MNTPGDGAGGTGGPGRGDESPFAPEPAEAPRIPPPRPAAEDSGHWPAQWHPAPDPASAPDARPAPPADDVLAPPEPLPSPPSPPLSHAVLKSLLGAWALTACSPEETAAVEAHLNHCTPCAEEALRLRDAVGLLHTEQSLDLDPLLRSRVLAGCLGRRPARIPVPDWAGVYDAEAARLDALLRDMGEAEWRAPVRLRWFDGKRLVGRDTTVAGVIGHLLVVDGILASSLGLPDPLGARAPGAPADRTEAYWHGEPARRPEAAGEPGAVREPWREQGHALVRTVSFAGRGVRDLSVPYGDFSLPLGDSFVDRAFECWVHAGDIAEAIDYPYEPPASAHLTRMVDLCARLLPDALAERRRAGLAGPPRRLVEAGAPGRTLHLEVEGSGDWYIPLDSPAARPSPEEAVAHIALDREAFYQLAAGHVPPQEAAAGQLGDTEAIRDVLFATASLSRL
ncbi:maleylpyruvate isomerase N-terminal domain-containing protein [Streptomyces sp. ME19-01-6]|uniref:maleylpyruvate isomerase N-terminal domain-containing protein n=1 Tax=Streptomyces sp. ME19-01-6 TaxID=3028686 RepID=UPI0029BA33D0|nr:maleylpyruvate isomerase N-terminal domain-containing protein [Streptomyces sp. ME19-01-6]MDX3227379.1 maleylpyruvate isomerase N-terminal domain-containing protein [Streptomyces sp. ME19-01-6]